MKKKEIVTLALTTALLMTAHAVPASAASNAPESMSQQGSIHTITPRWESTDVVVPSISISGKQISVSVYISPKKSTKMCIRDSVEQDMVSGSNLIPHKFLFLPLPFCPDRFPPIIPCTCLLYTSRCV